MYLNVYVPQLQREQGVASFFRVHRGHRFGPSVLMDPISKSFVAALEQFAQREKVPVDTVPQRTTERRYRSRATEEVGETGRGRVHRQSARESAGIPHREEAQRNHRRDVPWLVRSTAMVNQFYVYCVDSDFGPSFLKFSSYFPYTAKLCINGHEYAKQQLVQKGIGFQAHSCHYRRRGSLAACGLQEHAYQAVSQRRPRLTHRNHHSLPCSSCSVCSCMGLPIRNCGLYWRNCWASTQPTIPSGE